MLALMRWLETEGGKATRKVENTENVEEKGVDGFEKEVSLEKNATEIQKIGILFDSSWSWKILEGDAFWNWEIVTIWDEF